MANAFAVSLVVLLAALIRVVGLLSIAAPRAVFGVGSPHLCLCKAGLILGPAENARPEGFSQGSIQSSAFKKNVTNVDVLQLVSVGTCFLAPGAGSPLIWLADQAWYALGLNLT